MTPEQQRAIAIARARKRKAEAMNAGEVQNTNTGRELAGGREQVAFLNQLDNFTRKGNTGRATTAALSAANASTLGALDPIMDGVDRIIPGASGPSSGSVRGMLRKEHPVSAIGGDLVGFAAPGGAGFQAGNALIKGVTQLPGRAAPYAARLAGLAGLGGAENALFQSTVSASNQEADTGKSVGIPERLEMAQGGATDPLALAAGPVASTLYRGGRGVFTGKVTPKSMQPGANAPEIAAIQEMKSQAYKASDEMGVSYTADGFQDLVASIEGKLSKLNVIPKLHKSAVSVLELLQDSVGTPKTLQELDGLRQVVRRELQTRSPNITDAEKMFGSVIIDEIDDFIQRGQNVASGSGEQAAEAITRARALNSVYRKAQTLEDAVEAATLRSASTGSGGNFENALRQEIRKIYTNPRKIAGFSEAERTAMRKVIEGDTAQNLLRNVGKLSPQGNGLMAALGIGTTAANPWLAPVWLAGAAAKHMSQKGIKNKFDDLDNLVRGEANALAMRNITPPSAPPTAAPANALAGPQMPSPPARLSERIPESAYFPERSSGSSVRMARPERPTTLTQAVKNLGGIKTRYGNFQENLSRGEFEMIPGLVNDKTGKSADDIVRALREDGFDIVDENDLYRALNNERAGQKTFRIGEGEEYEMLLDAYRSRPN